jgi:hypothetical protein
MGALAGAASGAPRRPATDRRRDSRPRRQSRLNIQVPHKFSEVLPEVEPAMRSSAQRVHFNPS